MEIKKVLNLSDEEFDKLMAAGELVREISKLEIYDELSSGAKKILEALRDVINEVLGK